MNDNKTHSGDKQTKTADEGYRGGLSQRTSQQNRALHKYLSLLAEELDRNGHTLQDVVKAIKKAEIRPTPNALKEVVWKPMQEIMLGKKSTTELTKLEVDQVYEMVNAFIGREFHFHIPFPAKEHDNLAGSSADYPVMK